MKENRKMCPNGTRSWEMLAIVEDISRGGLISCPRFVRFPEFRPSSVHCKKVCKLANIGGDCCEDC